MLAWSILNWIFVDEGPRYFVEDRRRILLLLVIVVVGTVLLLAYEALSEKWKRVVALLLMGGLAVGTTACSAWIIYSIGRTAPTVLGWRFAWMALLPGLIPGVVAGWFWWLFVRVKRASSMSVMKRQPTACLDLRSGVDTGC